MGSFSFLFFGKHTSCALFCCGPAMIAAVACPDVAPLTEVVVSFACVPAELATRWSLLLDRGLFDPV